MDFVVAGSLLDEDVAIDHLQDEFGVVRNLHVEIEDHAIPVVAVAAIVGAVGRAERAVLVAPHEVALLRHVHLDVAFGFRHGLSRIGVNVLLNGYLDLRPAGAGHVHEAVDIVHQQLPGAAPGGDVESAPDGLFLVELPAVVVPAAGRQRQGRHHQYQRDFHPCASILCSAQAARCRTISSIFMSLEILARPGAAPRASNCTSMSISAICTSGDSCSGMEFTIASATSGPVANFWSASTGESRTLTLAS